MAFIADSRLSQVRSNAESFQELLENLEANDIDVTTLPLVIQFNKRDLPDVRDDDELHAMALRNREPVYEAIASQGVGVVETFVTLFQLTFEHLNKQHELDKQFGFDEASVTQALAAQLGMTEPEEAQHNCRYGDIANVTAETGA